MKIWEICQFVPNYTLGSSVIGLFVYNTTGKTIATITTLTLRTKGDPILVNLLPRISLPGGEKNATMECARVGNNGSFGITKMTSPNVCIAQDGDFALVFQSKLLPRKRKRDFGNGG